MTGRKGTGKFRLRKKVVAHTSKGSIEGEICVCNDTTKEKYNSFKHIPYACPPLAELRFARPKDFSLFEHVDYSGSTSYHKESKEDVLRLHIYTPEVRGKNSDEEYTRPVIVFVPGQLNFDNYSPDVFYGPHFLMMKDLVLVVVSYRQGFLGFTKFNDPNLDADGESGLRDIMKAFYFVKEEIVNFGGNPNNVTAYGQGLGAGYVRAIAIDPRFDNLFNKLILSSSMEHCMNIQDGSVFDGVLLADVLSNQKPMEEKDALEFLRSLKYEDFKKDEDPVFHKDNPRALTKVKVQRFHLDNFDVKMPVMIGFNSKEGLIETMIDQSFYYKEWVDLISLNLQKMRTHRDFQHCQETAAFMQTAYRNLLTKDLETTHREHFMSDINYNLATLSLAAHLTQGMAPEKVFLYRCAVELKYNSTKKRHGYLEIEGTAHGDELGYIFKTPHIQNVKKNSNEEDCIKRMTTMWHEFALKGDPNPADPAPLKLGIWRPVETPIKECFNINSRGATFGDLPEHKRLLYWEKIFQMKLGGKKPVIESVGKRGKKKRGG